MADKKDELIKKALTDPKFKAELLKNPAAAIEKATGVKVPAGVTVKIVEDSASTVHLVLPSAAPAAKGEISDDALSSVSGGAGSGNTVVQCQSSSSGPMRNICK